MSETLKATVAGQPRYVRSGRALVVPCMPELAGELALRQLDIALFRERYGNPLTVLWPGREIVVTLEGPPRYIGAARVVAQIDVPGAGATHALEKFNADTIRRRNDAESR